MANSIPFNAILVDDEYDRVYKAEDWAWYFATFIGNGIFPKPSDGLQVVAYNGMEIKVNVGYAFINGYAFRNPEIFSITLEMAERAQNRIDRVVVRWDLSQRDIYIAVIKGTASAKPVAAAVTRNTEIWELAIADIYIGKGVTRIQTQNITDQRFNSSICGIVTGTVKEIDASVLTKQFNDFFNNYSNEVAEKYRIYIQNIQEYINSLEESGDEKLENLRRYFNSLSDEGMQGLELLTGYFNNLSDQAIQKYEDFKAEILAYIEALQERGDTELAIILQGFIEFREENEADFYEWFDRIRGALASVENGEMLERIQYLLEIMYDVGTTKDIDMIITDTFVDDDNDNGFFEAGTKQDIDEIIAETFVTEDQEETTGQKIKEMVDRSFEEV